MIRHIRNLGFAGGHNQAFRLFLDKLGEQDPTHVYVAVVNQDVILTPTTLEKLVEAMEAHPHVGSVQPKLLRAYIEHAGDDVFAHTVCAERIDSTGIKATHGREFFDRGAGALDEGQFDEKREIFGPTGACALYRARALLDVRVDETVFDPTFFMYREDVDLAWRLQWAGWDSLFVPEAVAYHHRGLFAPASSGWLERIARRRAKHRRLAAYSTRNLFLSILKNESFLNMILAWPWILFMVLRQVLYSLFFEPWVCVELCLSTRLLPHVVRMRRATFRSAKRRSSALRRLFR